MGKTFKDRRDVRRNRKEISKLKKKTKYNKQIRREDYDDGRR